MQNPKALEPEEDFTSRGVDCLPNGWESMRISDLGPIVGGSTPSREVPAYWRGIIPWLTPGEITGNEHPLLYDTMEHISTLALRESGTNLLPPGSLLVTTRATLGERVINAVPMATNQGFKSIVFDTPDQGGYFFHLLPSLRSELIRRASGTTFLEISAADFKAIPVLRPPQVERVCIAGILDLLSQAVFETQALIEKLKQMKLGLMHDLLTRGIASNGELRSDAEQRPELYQPSFIGLIPKAMEATPLGKALEGIDAGWSPSCPEEPPSDGEWGVLKVSAITGGEFRAGESKRLPPELRADPNIEVQNGDVLLARANGVADWLERQSSCTLHEIG
jgi:type I restriction enzyme S subunit